MQVVGDWINSLPGAPVLAPPIIIPAGGTFSGSVVVNLQQTNANAALYFTLDGTLPDTNSFLYTAPFLLTNSATVSANAFAAGFNNSIATKAVFALASGVPSGISFVGTGSLTNGVFIAQVSARPTACTSLQLSDFSTWIPVNTNVPASSPFELVDPKAGIYRFRFYRAVQLP